MYYRHELKFLVSDAQLEMIRYRLKLLMRQDLHQKDGIYTVRSLYFDDFGNSCMEENENGIDNRRKYRIRIYDGNDGVIKLEKKIKCRGMTRKVSREISRKDCLLYMSGRAPLLAPDSAELEKELYAEMKMSGMKPVTVVEYERCAFVEPRGNVRVTFDKNISGSEAIGHFLDKKIMAVPLLPKGNHVLEVKYDELLPEYIAQALEISVLQRTAFSKYYYARNYKQN
ncbi:MAG: polyphosphate polymerase domain-containing protein [Lachnospiraceae bacterium]|nr:polyphosphate polymerase domain-containing protein [Lachnospiraceae bacterium]